MGEGTGARWAGRCGQFEIRQVLSLLYGFAPKLTFFLSIVIFPLRLISMMTHSLVLDINKQELPVVFQQRVSLGWSFPLLPHRFS